MSIHIRPARHDDAALILRFVTELAIYEHAEHEVLATEASLQATLLAEDAVPRALICEVDGEPAGFAVYFFSYSTWLAKNGIYLEDIYISPAYRGRKAGKALLEYLAKLAVENDCGRFEWNVLDWNESAIAFYQGAGARAHAEWIRYRIAGDALHTLAGA